MNVLHCPGLFWNSSWWLASKYKHATFAINEKSYLKFSTPLSPPHAIIVTRGLHVLHQTAKWILGLLVWWKWVLCGNIILNIITQLPFALEWKIKNFAHNIHLLLHWVQLGDIFWRFCSSKIWHKCEAAGVWNLPDSQKRILRISQHLETGSFWNITLWIFHNSMK